MISHTESDSVATSSLLGALLLLLGLSVCTTLTFAIHRLFLLLSTGREVSLFGLTTLGRCSHKDVRVGLLQLAEHFLPVLSLRKTARKQFY